MKVLVCGARDWTDRATIRAWLRKLPKTGTIIVHGGARGADTIAGEEALALGFEVRAYPVDTRTDGPWPGAGPRRNARMLSAELKALDAGLAFTFAVPDEQRAGRKSITPGSLDMIVRLVEAGVRVTIVPPARNA